MPISHTNCTPYLSATLFHTDKADPVLAGKLRSAIANTLGDAEGRASRPVARQITTPFPRKLTAAGLDVCWFHYSEQRAPPWYTANDLTDTYHQIVVICRKGKLLSISFSDTGARSTVMRAIANADTGPFLRLKHFSPAEIEAAFVENRVRTLWLSGVHRRLVIKPDAKVLSGLELESALDPLGDQSYYFSSIRSTSGNENLAVDGWPVVIGASPRQGRIWIGPTRSWDEFTGRMALILDQAAEKTAGPLPAAPSIPILAQASPGMAGVQQPYDMAVIVPELSLAGIDPHDGEERWLQQFSDAARFEVEPQQGSPNFEADVFWGDEKLGRLAYQFEERAGSALRLSVQKREWEEAGEHQQALFDICRNADYLTIYFDTGHTFSRGQFYKTQFRDARFADWRWVNMDGFNVRQEKPVDGRRFAIENLGNDDDDSLFGLVARHWPDLEGRRAPAGWLVCDDGAMESADFIYFDDTLATPQLTLIHVKGSHSEGGGLSVSDYEVVVGQAVKNLRHIDRGLLAEKLEANKNTQLRDAVWRDGERQQNRDGVLAALAAAGSNMEKTVVVLQPRVRRSMYDDIRGRMDGGDRPSAEIRRMLQLDALLLGARLDCFALGARFVVIADDDN